MHVNPFPASNNHASTPLELIHSDVHDMGHHTFTGYRYWVMFIDDYSLYQFIYPIRRKSEVFQTFKNFKMYAENQSGHHIKTLHNDKGGEYMPNEFEQFMTQCGITRQHTVRNGPQQKGVAKRANQSLSERIIDESGMPKAFWGECLATLVHTWNRCPTKTIGGMTPYQLWHGQILDVSHLWIWGCTAYVHTKGQEIPPWACI